MLKILTSSLRTKGKLATLELAYRLLTPKRKNKISTFPIYYNYFKEKNGLEIGGPTNQIFGRNFELPIYPIISNLDNVGYKSAERKTKGKQFICDATDLSFIASESYDFILASHVIEHIANPLEALSEWLRILKTGGAMLLIVPHKDNTFDRNRLVTSFSHIANDFNNDTKEDDNTHYDEWLKFYEPSLDHNFISYDDLKTRTMNNGSNRHMHHHVFNSPLVVEMLAHLNLQILSIDPILPFHIIALGVKVGAEISPNNANFLLTNATYRQTSPFKSDRLVPDHESVS